MAVCRIRPRRDPSFIQIGTEGGILPGVAVRANQPINYDYDRGSATFGNVQNLEGADPAIKGVTVFLGTGGAGRRHRGLFHGGAWHQRHSL